MFSVTEDHQSEWRRKRIRVPTLAMHDARGLPRLSREIEAKRRCVSRDHRRGCHVRSAEREDIAIRKELVATAEQVFAAVEVVGHVDLGDGLRDAGAPAERVRRTGQSAMRRRIETKSESAILLCTVCSLDEARSVHASRD